MDHAILQNARAAVLADHARRERGCGEVSGEAVSVIVKRRVAAVGIDPNSYSGHSLRAGFATSAAQIGVPSWKIRAQTGHASDAMLAHYIRIGEIFVENPAGILL